MKNYITIDGGTTNTRVSLVVDGIVIDTIKINIGAQKSIDGGEALRKGIKDAIVQLLHSAGLTESNIEKILASGMITSEFGLCKVDHIETPAGIDELAATMYETHFEDISSLPFAFVRGVKSVCHDLAYTDMMRGEETELMGIMNSSYGECVYVLPGSHSKIIRCDKEGRIAEFSTLLTGEMAASISQNTILRDAVDLSVECTDKEYLVMGYSYATKHGINNALFKVRVLKNLFGASKEQVYSFYVGVILQGEIEQIVSYNAPTVVIGGKKQLKEAMAHILETVTDYNVIVIDDNLVNDSVSRGIIRIYEHLK